MFDRFTPEARDESVSSMTDILAEGSGIIVSAVEGFYARIAAGESLKDSYVLLEDELQTGRYRRSSKDPRLQGVSPQWAIRKALHCAESRRRDDALMNPYVSTAEEWELAEVLLDRLEPITLADIQEQTKARRGYGKLSGPAASDLVVRVANENPGRIIPVRAKIGGKVAYGVIDSDERPTLASGEERDRWYEPKEIR